MTKPVCFFAGALLLSLVSCKKDYHCQCTTVSTVETSPGNFTTETFPGANSSYGEKMKQPQAASACEAEEKVVNTNITNWYTENGTRPLKEGESINTDCSLN